MKTRAAGRTPPSQSKKPQNQRSILSFFGKQANGSSSSLSSTKKRGQPASIEAADSLPNLAQKPTNKSEVKSGKEIRESRKRRREPENDSPVSESPVKQRTHNEIGDGGKATVEDIVEELKRPRRSRKTRRVVQIVESDEEDDGEANNKKEKNDSDYEAPEGNNDESDVEMEELPSQTESAVEVEESDLCTTRETLGNGTDLGRFTRSKKVETESKADAVPRFHFPVDVEARQRAREKLSAVRTKSMPTEEEEGCWNDLHPWSRDIRDANKRRPGEEGYDPSTLYVPPSEFTKTGKGALTPAQKQYWSIKMKNYDVLVFTKKGRFYELFDLDADLVHRELNLTYSKLNAHEMRCCGIPEKNFNRHVARLLDRGYKIGRVEQTETANAAEKRKAAKSGGPNSSVIQRALVRILTKATVTEDALLKDHRPRYLFAILEEEGESNQNVNETSASNEPSLDKDHQHPVGVCYVDVASGTITLREFVDDFRRSETDRLVAYLGPQEIIMDKNAVSERTKNIIEWACNKTGAICVSDFVQFPLVSKERLQRYRTGEIEVEEKLDAVSDFTKSYPIAGKCFAAVAKYLEYLMIDKETISLGQFNLIPPSSGTGEDTGRREIGNTPGQGAGYRLDPPLPSLHMDASTLASLEVLCNLVDGSEAGTLLSIIDRACTMRGRRLLRKWLASPLSRAEDIEERLSAVDALIAIDEKHNGDMLKEIMRHFLSGKDLERALPKLNQQSAVKETAIAHDDTNTKRVQEFLKVLRTLERCLQAMKSCHVALASVECKSSRLKWLVRPGGAIPDEASSTLAYFFEDAFDVEMAESQGVIIPKAGASAEYDERKRELKDIDKSLRDVLRSWQKKLKNDHIKFSHRGQEFYQLEISIAALGRNIPAEFELVSQTKQVKRFYTPEIRALVKEHIGATEALELAGRNVAREMVGEFNKHSRMWTAISKASAELDALIGLARTSQGDGNSAMCRPTILPNLHEEPVFHARALRHPVLASKAGSESFIPNDVRLGSADHPRIAVLTGPNAGGKSTLARQVAVCAILAQTGCYVPGDELTMRPFEDVYVRMGASDDIARGRSTFMTEMEEVGNFVNNATGRSLVIADEVGRGTSTHDGYAVAFATLRHLAKESRCICIFSTHYSMLGADVTAECEDDDRKCLGMYEMAAQVDEVKKEITFLYKFQRGVSGHSRGICCARVAGIPPHIADEAEVAAENFEKTLAERLGASTFQMAVKGLRATDEQTCADILRML